jgi:hypothetical protein
MSDRKAAQPERPATEPDEVTPEMIRAGADVLCRCYDEFSSFGEHVAGLVYQAMRDAARQA